MKEKNMMDKWKKKKENINVGIKAGKNYIV